MPSVYDQNGNRLGILPGEDQWSFGGSLWEFLHPGQVQAEDVAIGAPERSYSEIMSDAAAGMATAAEEQRQQIVQESKNILNTVGPGLLIGVVAVAAIVVFSKR